MKIRQHEPYSYVDRGRPYFEDARLAAYVTSSAGCIALRPSLGNAGAVGLRCLNSRPQRGVPRVGVPTARLPGVEIAGRASTGHQALRLAAALEPEVALVDIELAGEDGIALKEELDARSPSTCIVLISTYERDDLADLILGSPAVGFLPKAPSAPPRSQVCSAHAPESLRLEDTIVYVTTTRLLKRFP